MFCPKRGLTKVFYDKIHMDARLQTVDKNQSSVKACPNTVETPHPNLRTPMFPVPTTDIVENAKVVVSIALSGSQVSWCCMEKTTEQTFILKELQYHPLLLKNKQHFLTNMSEMATLSRKIPQYHLCLIEDFPKTPPNPQLSAYLSHMNQLRSLLLGSLTTRLDASRIVAIKTVAVARLFNTVVGAERVSCQHIVDNMITWKPLPSLIIPHRLKFEYENYSAVTKEGLANSILLNLAYWKLTKQFTDTYT